MYTYVYVCIYIYVYRYISFVTSSIDYLALIDITLSNESRYWHVHCCFLDRCYNQKLVIENIKTRWYVKSISALHCTHVAKITATLARTASVG